jgi:ankyrin repeat protein
MMAAKSKSTYINLSCTSYTSYIFFFIENHSDMIEFLFESGCNIAAQDNSGQTAAHYGK